MQTDNHKVDDFSKELGELTAIVKETYKRVAKIETKLEDTNIKSMHRDIDKLKERRNFDRGVIAVIVFVIVCAKDAIINLVTRGIH